MRLLDGNLQTVNGNGIFGTDINVTFIGTDGIAGNGHSLQDCVRVAFQNRTVHESSRVAFVGVTYNVLLVGCILSGEAPLKTCGESSASSSAKTGR